MFNANQLALLRYALAKTDWSMLSPRDLNLVDNLMADVDEQLARAEVNEPVDVLVW